MNFTEYNEEQKMLVALENRDVKAFMRLGREYKDDLIIYAFSHLNDRRLAVDTVDEFLDDLWAEGRFAGVEPPIYRFLIGQLSLICLGKKGPPSV
jgi:hypothetical protein